MAEISTKRVKTLVKEWFAKSTIHEWKRLKQDPYHQIEFIITRSFLETYLPKKGLILDAGGGPGRYTIELAKWGYNISKSCYVTTWRKYVLVFSWQCPKHVQCLFLDSEFSGTTIFCWCYSYTSISCINVYPFQSPSFNRSNSSILQEP